MKLVSYILTTIAGMLTHVATAQNLQIDSVQFGYSNTVFADRYTVLRFMLSSGEQPWSGSISVRLRQDSTQEAIYSTRFSTTPGISTPLELPVLMPSFWSNLEFIAASEQKTIRFDVQQYGAGATGVISAPAMPTSSLSPILIAGETSANDVLSRQDAFGGVTEAVALPTAKEEDSTRNANQSSFRFETGPVHQLAENGLPLHMEGFDQFAAVVVSERAWMSQSRASKEALVRWVISGGKLLVSLDTAGATPIALFPEFEPFLLNALTLNDSREITADAHISTVGKGEAEVAPALTTTQSRTVTLTDEGRSRGWSLEWKTTDGDGLLARGPVGFGIVGFLTIDPKHMISVTEVNAPIARRLLWEDAVRVVASRDGLGRSNKNNTSNQFWYSGATTGPSVSTQQALTAALEKVTPVQPLGISVFVILIVMLMFLGIMIGPGDMLILKRFELRHRSWLTACVWIALASLVAGVLPLLLRDGRHGYSLLTVVDVLQRGDGTSLTSRTGVVGMFGGRPDLLPLPKVQQNTRWRGISSTQQDATRTFEPLRFLSGEIGEAGSRAALLNAPGDPPSLRIGQWSFRTMMFNEPARFVDTGLPRVRVRRDNFGVMLEVAGITKATQAQVKLDGHTYDISLKQENEKWIGALELSDVSDEEPTEITQSFMSTDDAQIVNASAIPSPDLRPLGMQWAEDRADAFHTAEHDGNFALVLLETRSDVIDGVTESIGEKGQTNQIIIYRIAAPVERITP